ncbi:MAG: DNA ligase D, partial [Chitinophagaceae bacterium]
MAVSRKSAPDSFPGIFAPMLATLADKPVNSSDWLYEVKWDGYRAIAYVNEGAVEIISRNGKSFNEKFYPIFNELEQLGMDVVLDGEVVALNSKGGADFSALQGWRSEDDGLLIFYVFDLLYHNGKDLCNTPLTERRKLLREVISETNSLRVSKTFEGSGDEAFAFAASLGLEGVIAKKADSLYLPGKRSKEWLKVKTEKHQEAVIGGYTINEGTPKPFSALLLGVYEGNEFRYIGPVGTGFSVSLQKEILQRLKPLETPACPFPSVPE